MNLKENLEEFAELQRKLEQREQSSISGGGGINNQISNSNSVLKRALEEGTIRQTSNAPGNGNSVVPAMEETKLASVLSMVMCCQNIDTVMDDLFEHVRKEIKTQCVILNINPGELF